MTIDAQERSAVRSETAVDGRRLAEALVASLVVSLVGRLIVVGHWTSPAIPAANGAAVAVLPMLIFVVVCVLTKTRMSSRAVWALGANVAFYVILDAATIVPNARWLPSHKWNWEGKAIAIVATLSFVGVLFRGRFRPVGMDGSLMFPKLRWKLIAPLIACAYLFVLGGYFLLTSTRVRLEEWLFEATMPGIAEEMQRGVNLMLLAAAITGVLSIRSIRSFKVMTIVILADSLAFGLEHALHVNSHWKLEFDVGGIVPGVIGVVFGVVLLRARSVWPGVALHNTSNLESFVPTQGLLLILVLIWGIWHRVARGKFPWEVTASGSHQLQTSSDLSSIHDLQLDTASSSHN